jgi:hypothetical protein
VVLLAGYWCCRFRTALGVGGSYSVAEGAKIDNTPHHSQNGRRAEHGRCNASPGNYKACLYSLL